MAEPMKDAYDRAYIERVAAACAAASADFDPKALIAAVFAEPWPELELKARMRRISDSLHAVLPGAYPDQLRVICDIAPAFDGYLAMFLPDFVEVRGLEHWEESLRALEWLTRHSSAEFAVRPFIRADSERMMARMRRWCGHENEHVRRLASEGCRSRLPWAEGLPQFKHDPTPILPILERLRADESEYVRRSVANSLNDISCDHPELALELFERWLGERPETDRLIKHAARTLLKRGDRRALALFGFGSAEHVEVRGLRLASEQLPIGGTQRMEFELLSDGPLGAIRLEYAVDHRKARGHTTRKVFRISEFELEADSRQVRRRHEFKQRTARRLHPGEHRITILVNGEEKAAATFELLE